MRNRGFGIWMGNFRDILTDATGQCRDQRVHRHRRFASACKDPVVAEKLIPKDHGFGTRRVPLESGYFEAYNRDNVVLVDTIHDEPIVMDHAAGHQDEQAGIRLRYAGLRDGFRRCDRCLRPHRHSWSAGCAAQGRLVRMGCAPNSACSWKGSPIC